MANNPPGAPIAPGIVAPDAGFPQWGVKMNSDQSAGTIRKAGTAAQKQSAINDGYLSWFSSNSAATEFISSQTSVLNGSFGGFLPGLGGLVAEVTTFLKDLGDASTWQSLGWMVLGAVLLVIGIVMWVGKVGAPKIESALGTVAGAAVKAP